ncbi:hydrolase [Streptomyces sp. NPDC093984]|uniref:hydrolase n=1 Tax=Streptomyces sp. NPDC093984 TaxID=3366052 RepID=UPI0038217077
MLERTLPNTGLLSAAKDVATAAERSAAAAEADRRLDTEVVKEVVAAGFARHFVPRDAGGNAGTFTELSEAVVTVGASCPATAWCASLFANLARMAAFLPAEGYREIWAEGPDAVVVGSLTPAGKATEVPGGWRLSGAWSYISAVDFSDWALVAGMVVTEAEPQALMFAVPRSAYSVVDSWSSVGMRATGSNTLVLDDVFVPAPRAFRREDLFAGRAVDSTAACHSVPLQAANGLSFATPTLGAAQGALRTWSQYIGEKLRTASVPGRPPVNRAAHERTLSRSSGEIDAARLLLERASAVADLGSAVSPLQTARNLRDCSLAVEQLVTAVDRLFRAGGTSGQSEHSPMQRFWRDVNAASTHVALQFDAAAGVYGGEVFPS